MLIVIEGFDGCGKDSVANAVAQALGAERLNFPNDAGYTGPAIREYLRKEWWVSRYARGGWEEDRAASALAFQGLQIANRMEVMPRLEQAAGSSSMHMVLARYWQSAWVYGQLDGLDPTFLLNVHASMAKANLSVLLDAPAEVCLARRAARDGKALAPERYEGKLELAQKAIALYRELWATTLGWPACASEVIDATLPLESVIAEVMSATEMACPRAYRGFSSIGYPAPDDEDDL